MQNHERFAAVFAPDFHVLPAKLRADAGAESFGNGFLACKPRRQKGRRGAVRQTVLDLAWVQNPTQEPLAKSLERGLNSLHFDNVNSDAENHR